MTFTFHYVSIKTGMRQSLNELYLHLHSTMYLLKLCVPVLADSYAFVFTFHYVSIKT